MDHQSLVAIAQRAILQVLKYHFVSADHGPGVLALDQQTRNTISANIRRNLPLVAYAADHHKAYLEIVCDASLPVADKYDINKRWFYTAVQGLTSMELVPSLYENAAVPVRLSTVEVQVEDIASFEDEEEEGMEATTASTAANSSADFDQRRPWTAADMVELIELKFEGMRTKAIANKMSRSQGSVHCTWLNAAGDMDKQWFQYIHKKLEAGDRDTNGKPGSTSLGKRKRASSL